ncbi:hypothetical protein BDN70DRAFT_888714, partial [Pholiota conissans]
MFEAKLARKICHCAVLTPRHLTFDREVHTRCMTPACGWRTTSVGQKDPSLLLKAWAREDVTWRECGTGGKVW